MGGDESAVHVQRVVRGFLGRLAALRQANLVYEKIFDPRTHAYYYYNTHTFETTWQPPTVVTRILGEFGDLDTIAPTYTDEEAAVMLQAAWRRRRGIRIARGLLASVVSKVLDESTGAHYYYNSLTGETSWTKPALFGSEDVESYPQVGLLAEGHEGGDPLSTVSYGYEQSQGWEGQQAWTQEQQEQEQQPELAGGAWTEEAGYEGWVWDDTSGWYYDEELAARQAGGADGLLKDATESPAVVDTNSTSGAGDESGAGSGSVSDSDSDSDSSSGDDAVDAAGEEGAVERKKRRRKRRRPSLPPRNYPRSKAQRLVDEVEDSVEGARPEALDLSNLDMDRVTSRVYRLDWLRRLDLSSNRLYRISPDLASLESLIDVDLRHNRIAGIPDDLEALTQLKHLRLGHNRISGFRGNIYLISSLETLDLGHNRLKEVPLQVGDLQLLKRTREWEIGLRLLRELVTLDVSYNRLKQWPPQVHECRNLRDLRLNRNKLQEVPDVVGDNQALTYLDLSGNSLKGLPDTINSLSELTHLDVSDNKLKSHSILPVGRKEKGSRLKSLAVLRLNGNRLKEGPTAVETFQTLTDLNLSNNPIKGWVPHMSGLRKIKHLRLKGVGLDRCPEGLEQLNKLENLDLSNNSIDVFEQSAASLFKLKMLDLSGNNIPDLGSCVGSMVSLMHLDASGNELELISPELSRCTALEFLDLSGGTVDHIPETFSKLTRLRVLRAQDNQLRAFPPEFETLTALEELRLGGNRLRSLPISLEALQNMRYAELSRNMMTSPPAVTRRWPLLAHLVLSRNPLEGRRLESLRLLQAAQRGHDAMHRGEWEEAAKLLDVAADAHNRAIHAVPDFPDPDSGEGPPLAETRPHDMDAFHHVNLGVAHLQAAREASSELEAMNLRKAEGATDDGSAAMSLSVQSVDLTEDSSMVTISTGEREARRQQELRLLSLRGRRNRHHEAAVAAYSYADQLEQLSRPVGRSAGVWLGRAAVAADMGRHAAALDDLERALVQLRKNAKVRILLAKSRVELGQYERGLTDCGVAARLLDSEERVLEEIEAEQKRRAEEAAAQAAKAESIRQAEERIAARQRQEAEATEAARQKEGGDSPQHSEEGAERPAGPAAKAEQASPVAPSGEEEGTAPKSEDAVSPDQSLPDEVVAAGGPTAPGIPTGATPGVDGTAITAMYNSQAEGGEQSQATAGDILEAAATAGTSGGNLPAIAEEASGPEEIVAKSAPKALNEGKRDQENDPREQPVDHDEKERDNGTVEGRPAEGTVPQPREALQDAASHEEVQSRGGEAGGSLGRVPASGPSVTASAASVVSGSSGDTAHLELARRRKDVALLRAQAKEGMTFVSQSVDMADVLRGFVLTRHGIPVRDPGVSLELLREGRSIRRDRHRRLLAVEAAKKRERARDVGLMERAFRQATARQKSGKAAKARKAAAMAMYRNIEEAWERQQEEQESKRRQEAAERRAQHEILAAAEEEAYNLQRAPKDGGEQAALDVPLESSAAATKLSVPAEGEAAAEAASRSTTKKPTKKQREKQREKEEDDEDDEDDPEVQKVLARRARGADKKAAGRRR